MARTKKRSGFWKIHQDCGVCQKPRRHKRRVILKEKDKDAKEDIRGCKMCGGSGFVAVKQFLDDGWGEVDSCPACEPL